MNGSDSFEMLRPEMRQWIWKQGWKDLNPVQQAAIAPVLSRDCDLILAAPTASGKTEAAFLPIISDILQHQQSTGVSVLALSPLKSLINDQQRRLEEMTQGTGISVTAWHGDAASSSKRKLVEHPSGILLITPESLEAMLTLRPDKGESLFGALRYIVIDELHAFINSERGIQLQSLLSRINRPDVPRIALSATIGDKEEAATFLRPDKKWPVKAPDIKIDTPPARISVKEFIATDKLNPEEAITADLFERLRGSNNLIFTNSRKDAEAYALSLSRMSEENGVPDEFRIHHGSIAKAERTAVEKELQEGERPVTAICTASMELGVDIGRVNSIAQIGTAGSTSAMRQRLGRSGRRGGSPILRIYGIDEMRDDYKFHLRSNLVQNIAVTELLRTGKFESSRSKDSFLSIAVQQLIGLLGQYGSLTPQSAYNELARRGPFRMLTPSDFATLLKHLGGKRVIGQTNSGLIVIGEQGERILAKRDFFSAFTSAPDYTIIDNASRRSIGSVQYKPYYGEVFILGGEIWIVDSVEEKSSTVYVGKTVAKGKMMFEGTGPDITSEVTRKMKEVLMSDEEYPYLDVSTDAQGHLREARRWFRRNGLDNIDWYAGTDKLTLFTWGGMRQNRTIALMANAELGLSLQYDHLALQGLTPENVETLKERLPEGEDARAYLARLASHVNRAKKERGKFDPYLPDTLLDREYAASRLEVPVFPKAIEV